MKTWLLFTVLMITSNNLFAQITISGKVKDNKGRPLPGTSVSLKDTYDGTVVDSLGNFKFTTSEKGDFSLVVNAIGYNDFEQKITIGKEPIQLSISLKEKLDELKAVTVTAGAFAAGDSKRAATVLSPIDIVTVAGSNGDVSSALKTLPGAQQIGEQEGLFVRGGTGAETKQFIDGTVVNNPYYTGVPDIASRGRFSPFLFKGTVFTTGGYSALYGEALSSALILESIDLPEKSAANLFVSPIIVGGGYQNLAKNKKSSWGADYGYVNLIAYFNVVKQTPDFFRMPEFHNGDANFRIKTKSGGIIKYYTTFSKSNLGLRRPDIDSLNLKDATGVKNFNWYNNLSWRENLGKGWRMNIGASYSTNRDDIEQQLQDHNNVQVHLPDYWAQYKNFTVHNVQDLSQLRAVFEKRIGGISTLRLGGEYWYSVNNNRYNDTSSRLVDNFQSVFAETELHITNELAAQIGARFEHSSLINKMNIAPRISFAYKVGKDAQMSAAYGIFYQKPENQQLFFTTNLGYTKATHYIINY